MPGLLESGAMDASDGDKRGVGQYRTERQENREGGTIAPSTMVHLNGERPGNSLLLSVSYWAAALSTSRVLRERAADVTTSTHCTRSERSITCSVPRRANTLSEVLPESSITYCCTYCCTNNENQTAPLLLRRIFIF